MSNKLALFGLFSLVLVMALAEPTTLSYLIDVEQETRQDYLQMTITVTAENPSLETAIAQARAKATKLKQLEEQVCRQLIKDKSECKQSVQIGKVQIEPQYKENKKEKIYEKVTATYDIVVTIKQVQKFGQLVDQILQMEGIVIEKIEWIADEDLLEENFLEESIKKNNQLCAELGKKFVKLVSVEEIREQPEKPEEEEEPAEGEEEEEEEQEQEPEEEEEQEQEEVTTYRITIECDGKKETKKRSKK